MPEEQLAIIDIVPVGAMLRTVALRRGERKSLASMFGKFPRCSPIALVDSFRLFPYRRMTVSARSSDPFDP